MLLLNRLTQARRSTPTPWRRLPFLAGWPIAVVVSFATAFAVAQENEEEDEETTEATELEDPTVRPAEHIEVVVVTGSRLARTPSELSRDVIVIDQDAIAASGELTLPRLLRQLPQNVNGTNETYGSELNGLENVSGASTVNLRGLGSESTLILVDGRRIGYSGILGGVTDISTIPLSMVDRVEVLLDGASAIYGSDAVGGVVNVITKKDYEGIEISIDHGRPAQAGYDETRASISTGLAWGAGRVVVGFEHFYDSGLDASSRDTIIHANRDDGIQKNGLPGPQVRIYSNFFDQLCDAVKAVVYVLDGRVITLSEFNALSPSDQARAVCQSDLTVPSGFQSGDDLNGIDIFGPPYWGEDAEVGYSLRPEQMHNSINLGIDYDLAEAITLHGNLRYTQKESNANNGLNTYSAFFHAANPFNPFGRRVTAQAQILNAPPRFFEGQKEDLYTRLGADGVLGASGWQWHAEFSRSQEEIDAQRLNVLDSGTLRSGLNSDGTTPLLIRSISGITEEECAAAVGPNGGTSYSFSPPRGFFASNCMVLGPPAEPINPFGDLSGYVTPGLNTASTNQQTQFEAQVRGELFEVGGGVVALVAGYDFRQDVIDTMSEFHSTTCNALGCAGESPVNAAAFNTRIGRDTHSAFFEGSVPLVRSRNARSGVQGLTLTLSGRYDSYSNVEVEYRESASGEAGTDMPADPGAEFTWSAGLAYEPSDVLVLKANVHTSFVAPQLNQLISRTKERQPAASFRGLYFTGPDSMGRTQTHNNVFIHTGGNDKLLPETAETVSFSAEWAPVAGLSLKAGWSDTVAVDRIAYFSSLTGIDPNNLPSNVLYIPEDDVYIRDDRWVNVGRVDRSGLDLAVSFEMPTDVGDFSLTVRRAITTTFDVQADSEIDEVQSALKVRDDVSFSRDAFLPPVPAYQNYAQVSWRRGGFSLSLDGQAAGSTSTIRSGGTDGFVFRTEPATIIDMVVAYDFGQDTFFNAPSWMDGLRATFTVNNLTNAFARNSQVNRGLGMGDPERTKEYSINPFYEWTQGRSYRLTLHKSLSI